MDHIIKQLTDANLARGLSLEDAVARAYVTMKNEDEPHVDATDFEQVPRRRRRPGRLGLFTDSRGMRQLSPLGRAIARTMAAREDRGESDREWILNALANDDAEPTTAARELARVAAIIKELRSQRRADEDASIRAGAVADLDPATASRFVAARQQVAREQAEARAAERPTEDREAAQQAAIRADIARRKRRADLVAELREIQALEEELGITDGD